MYTRTLQIPEGVSVSICEEGFITTSGFGREISRRLPYSVVITTSGQNIEISSKNSRTSPMALANTFNTLLGNDLVRVKEPAVWKVEIQHGHFVPRVMLGNGKLKIQNFFGRKKDQTFLIPEEIENVEYVTEGNRKFLFITSVNSEKIGNFVVKVNNALKSKLDRRIFGDRLYILEKA